MGLGVMFGMGVQRKKLSAGERELIIRLFKNGKKQEEIAEAVKCSQPAVSGWIRAWKKGRKSFEDRQRVGRPTKLKGRVISRVRKKLQKAIKSSNDGFGHVSTKQCKEIIEAEVGRVYSIRHVERIMHQLGFSLAHDQRKEWMSSARA